MRLIVLLFPLLLAPSASVPPGILGRDDLDFARKLHDAGFDDLSQLVCKAIAEAAQKGGGFTPDDVVEATIVGFEAETSEAAAIDDPTAREQKLKEILERAGVFAKTLPDGPKSDRLGQALATGQQMYAESMLSLLQSETDPEKRGPRVKEADKIFTAAEEGLTKRVELLEEMRLQTQTDEELEIVDRKLIRDSRSLAIMYYQHSRALTGNEVKRRVVLRQGLETLQEFQLDWSGSGESYEAAIYEGLCWKDLGEDDKAVAAFDSAIAVRETFGPTGDDGRYPIPPETADLASVGLHQKMLFLNGKKDWAGSIATAEDFFKTTPNAARTIQGLAIMSLLADAQLASGSPAARETAQSLVELDPRGPWGGHAREILTEAAKTGGVDPTRPDLQLRIAETLIKQRDFKRAHVACRQAREISAGQASAADIGAESYLIDGAAFSAEGLKAEASVAYDAAMQLYPKGAKAPDALWGAINIYLDLYGEEKRGFYKKLTGERMAQFVKEFPKHPNAVLVSIISGRQQEAEGKFEEAAKTYQGVAASSSAYGEAQYRAGTALVKQAQVLQDQNKLADAGAMRKQAQPLLNNARVALERQAKETLDASQQARFGGLAFAARTMIAQLLLTGTAADVAQVEKLLEDVEAVYPDDVEKHAQAWALRIKALEKQARLQDAVAKLDGLLQKSPDAPTVAVAAGSLARALDHAANDLHVKDAASSKADAMWHDAARLYALSVKPQITGKAPLNARELEDVGKRLFSLTLTFEGAPEDADSFLDWQPKHLTLPENWEQIAGTFEALLQTSSSYRAHLFVGRVRGFQARWADAANAYARVFELEPIITPDGKRFDPIKRREKPELVTAYIEWGMTEVLAGKESGDKERLSRSSDILERALGANNLELGSKLWWKSQALQVEAMVARGQYDVAAITLRDLERNFQDYDKGEFGAKQKLLELKAEVDKRK